MSEDSHQMLNEIVDLTLYQSQRWLIDVSSITEVIDEEIVTEIIGRRLIYYRDNSWKNSHRDDWRKSRGNESHFLCLNPKNQKMMVKEMEQKKDKERLKKQVQPWRKELNSSESWEKKYIRI